jgi:hypothetical protein
MSLLKFPFAWFENIHRGLLHLSAGKLEEYKKEGFDLRSIVIVVVR